MLKIYLNPVSNSQISDKRSIFSPIVWFIQLSLQLFKFQKSWLIKQLTWKEWLITRSVSKSLLVIIRRSLRNSHIETSAFSEKGTNLYCHLTNFFLITKLLVDYPIVSLDPLVVSLYHSVVSLDHSVVSLDHSVVCLNHWVVTPNHSVVTLNH